MSTPPHSVPSPSPSPRQMNRGQAQAHSILLKAERWTQTQTHLVHPRPIWVILPIQLIQLDQSPLHNLFHLLPNALPGIDILLLPPASSIGTLLSLRVRRPRSHTDNHQTRGLVGKTVSAYRFGDVIVRGEGE
jgi:hypothetical protein